MAVELIIIIVFRTTFTSTGWTGTIFFVGRLSLFRSWKTTKIQAISIVSLLHNKTCLLHKAESVSLEPSHGYFKKYVNVCEVAF